MLCTLLDLLRPVTSPYGLREAPDSPTQVYQHALDSIFGTLAPQEAFCYALLCVLLENEQGLFGPSIRKKMLKISTIIK